MALCITCKEKKSNRPGSLCATCYAAKFRANEGPDETDEAALMKWVIDGAPCKRSIQKAYKADFNKNPRDFLKRYRELTGAAQAVLPNGNTITPEKPLVRDGKTPCPTCEQIVPTEDRGTKRALADLDEALQKALKDSVPTVDLFLKRVQVGIMASESKPVLYNRTAVEYPSGDGWRVAKDLEIDGGPSIRVVMRFDPEVPWE